jgi:GTP-binding protein HflX
LTTEGVKIAGVRSQKRSLVEAQEAAARHARSSLSQPERAVLVAVEFTGERRKLTAAARQAKTASAVSAGTALEKIDLGAAPKAAADLDFDASLAEFEELARSAGAEVAATLIQRRPKPDPATLVGHGKLDEIEGVIASTGADLVLFDHDLSPSQLRNLEAKLPCRVIDRTQLILDIFAKHARTREGQLQVELAQLEYQLPRLAGRGKSMSQLGSICESTT